MMTKEVKQEQGKPVAWLIDDKNINHLQIKTIQRLIERAHHAHMTDIKLRINGQDEWYEGDWLKHMVEAPQPKQEQGEPVCDECGVGGGYALYCLACAEKYVKPEWVGLNDEDIEFLFPFGKSAWLTETLKIFEAKLKEKNAL